jgi:Sensors of blue-light using FAD
MKRGAPNRGRGAGDPAATLPEADAMIRLVYCSRSTTEERHRTAVAQEILATARQFNTGRGITGLLAVTGGHYLQLLEGPRGAVEDLLSRIERDPRHDNLAVLMRSEAVARICPDWAMGMVTRSEPEEATAQRVLLLQQRLATDPHVSANDFFRLVFSPGIERATAGAPPRERSVDGVVFANPSGLWGAAIVQRIASDATVRLGRTSLVDPQDPSRRSLVEYVDLKLPGVGPVRALSLTDDANGRALLAPLIDRPLLLTLVMSATDVAEFPGNVEGWLARAETWSSEATILLISNLALERVEAMAREIKRRTKVPVVAQSVRLSDSRGIWEVVQRILRERAADRAEPVPVPVPSTLLVREAKPIASVAVDIELESTPTPASAPLARPVPEPVLRAHAATEPGDPLLAALHAAACIEQLLAIDGSLFAAVVQTQPLGVLLRGESTAGGTSPLRLETELLGEAELLRAEQAMLTALGIDDTLEDLALTTSTRLQVFRPLRSRRSVYLAVTLAREHAELAVVRMRMREIEAAIDTPPESV